MKKASFFALLFVVTAVSAQAQSGLGIKGGLNLTSISTDAGSFKNNIIDSYDTRTGYAFGIFGRLGNKVFLQPELMVSTKGGEIDVLPIGGGSTQTVKVKYTDIDVPVLVGVKPLKFVRIVAGPVVSLKVNENDSLRDALKGYTNDFDQAINDATFGYQLGVGVKLLGLELDLRRQGSLSDVSALNLPNEPKFSQRSAGWQFTVGIKIL